MWTCRSRWDLESRHARQSRPSGTRRPERRFDHASRKFARTRLKLPFLHPGSLSSRINAMKAELIDVSACKKNLDIEIPQEVVDREITEIAQEFAKRARVPG